MKYNGLVWSDTLLDNGKSHSQKEWVSLLKGTEWRLPTVKEYESLRGCKGKFMDDLRKEMVRFWLMTGDVLKSPFSQEGRPVVLGFIGGNDRFSIYADGGGYGNGPARGVAVKPKKKGREK